MDAPTDGSLVARAKAGDQDAFAALYERHSLWAAKMAHAIIFNEHVAEEVVQEAFFQAWRRLPSLRRADSFGPLLHTILVRIALRTRGAERHTNRVTEGKDIAVSVAWSHEVEERMAVRDALARLSPAHRAVLALRYLQGYKETEIARMMGCPAGTVRSRLFFARRHMAEYFEIQTAHNAGVALR